MRMRTRKVLVLTWSLMSLLALAGQSLFGSTGGAAGAFIALGLVYYLNEKYAEE